ncbi:MAG: biotin transporter BioY [Oliverpabstia sp.]
MSTTATTNRSKTYDMVCIAVFAVIIAICSWISIPATVPFTLQTFAIFLTVGVLGGKKGSLAVLVYILLGAVGIPVFAGFSAGVGVLFGNTGGYIIGFLASALVMWGMEIVMGRKTWALAIQMVVGLLVCYVIGTVWFMIVYAQSSGVVGLATVLGWCVIPFIIPDLIKIALALILSKRLSLIMRMI